MDTIDRSRLIFNCGFSEFEQDFEEEHPNRIRWEAERAADRAEVLERSRAAEFADLEGDGRPGEVA